MVIRHAFVLDDEFKFKTHFGIEFLQVEIPLPHLFDIGERRPNPPDRGVERALDNNCFRQLILRSHFSPFLFRQDTRSNTFRRASRSPAPPRSSAPAGSPPLARLRSDRSRAVAALRGRPGG